MEQWPIVLSDTLLLLVALAGGILTLVRVRRVGGAAAAFAGAACTVLVLATIFDMVWWLAIYQNAIEADDFASASTLNKIGILVTWFMLTIGVGLLIGAANAGRGGTPPQAAPQAGFAMPPAQPHTYGQPLIPQQAQPHQLPPQAQPQAQPAAGWPQPQQPAGQPDWNIHSGVWSIPRGTFDGPPPDNHTQR